MLNAREGIRGCAEGIRLVQEQGAEKRTLAVLTCVDRTDANDDVAAMMRQEKSRELPKLGHHYHAVSAPRAHATVHAAAHATAHAAAHAAPAPLCAAGPSPVAPHLLAVRDSWARHQAHCQRPASGASGQ